MFYCVKEPHFLFHSSVEGHLGCFQFLAVTNKATMNKVEQVSLWWSEASSGYTPRSLITGFWGRTISSFPEITRLISKVVVQVCFPTSNGEVLFILLILTSMCCHLSF